MEYIHFLLELLSNTKEVLENLTAQYPNFIYGILFLIIFVETGLVIMPFLPGDSLLFTAGMLCAIGAGALNIWILVPLLIIAAILGDNVNYYVGKYLSTKVLALKFRDKPMVKQEWIDEVHKYFEHYGSKTIVIARFMPIIRTITPFVAGIGNMSHNVFLLYNIIGAIIWVGTITIAGYALGNVKWVEDNLEKIIIGIVFVSVLPMLLKIGSATLKKIKG
ncbi:MAG TPA: VTT domain-containing protein [Chitinophagales bacterium]|nr:VTT domain-containing protein [Chitinophagales bacterium]